MLLLSARPAPFSGAQGHPCWRQQCFNAQTSNKHASALFGRQTHLPRRARNSRPCKRARTSTALPGGTDLQLQLPNTLQDSPASPDIFQSALNALSLGAHTESYDAGYDELHEDISLEQGQAAAQVGKAVYEVSHEHVPNMHLHIMHQHGNCKYVQVVIAQSPSRCRFSSCQAVERHVEFM